MAQIPSPVYTKYIAPTIVALGVLANKDGTCKQAGGFIIQLLPNASEEAYQVLEKLLVDIKSVSKLIEQAKTSDQIIYQLFKYLLIDNTLTPYNLSQLQLFFLILLSFLNDHK